MQTKHIAHIVIEADTPLKVGSNASDALQDSPIQKDWNGLPMILGTSISGVLRKDFNDDKNDIFGDEDSNKKDFKGSKLIVSNALLCIDDKNNVCEELLLEKSEFLKLYENLPIREHTAIDDKGVTENGAKFDEEVVYKGSCFKFSIELAEEDDKVFKNILNLLSSSSFRLGGGSSKGFGKFKVLEITTGIYTVDNYNSYSSSLNYPLRESITDIKEMESENFTKYILNIKPDDFFMFGSGFGDEDVDMTPVYEKVVDYKNAKLSESKILIPASGIKGALSHRTAFYYNKSNDNFIDEEKAEKNSKHVGENNKAIDMIFGHKKELTKDKKTELGKKGKILISDCFKSKKEITKTFDHVSIDRFTGGAIDGALFQEKTVLDDNECYEIEILLKKCKFLNKNNLSDSQEKEKALYIESVKAFESALLDICKGMLALGGSTAKGHGVFNGNLSKDGILIHEGNCDEK